MALLTRTVMSVKNLVNPESCRSGEAIWTRAPSSVSVTLTHIRRCRANIVMQVPTNSRRNPNHTIPVPGSFLTIIPVNCCSRSNVKV